jgi:hypothetical protein
MTGKHSPFIVVFGRNDVKSFSVEKTRFERFSGYLPDRLCLTN